MNFLTSNVVRAEDSTDFAEIQAGHIRAFREAAPETARVSQGLVVIPTDSATAEQRAKYAAYVEARSARIGIPQGPGKLLFAHDLVGTSEQIAEALYADAGFREVREVVFALPFSFEHEDYVQLLTDIATHLHRIGMPSAHHDPFPLGARREQGAHHRRPGEGGTPAGQSASPRPARPVRRSASRAGGPKCRLRAPNSPAPRASGASTPIAHDPAANTPIPARQQDTHELLISS